MKILGIIISLIQFLAIIIVFMLNPIVILYQFGWLILCIFGAIAAYFVLISDNETVKIFGLVAEVLYLFALFELINWVIYNMAIL